MFWKIGRPGSSESPRAGFGRWSIARRLALLHILAVLISYTVFGALLYAKRIKQLERDTLQDLDAERASVVAMLSEPDARVLLGYEIRIQQFEPEHLRPFIRILDREGRVLLETPGLESVVPRGAFPAPGAALRWRNGHGGSFLVRSIPLPDRFFSGPGGMLQLGISTHEEKALIHRLRLTLLIFITSGLLFAFGCAYIIVRLALKPLDDISATASNITRHRLDTRIQEASLPVELVSLAGSFNSMLGRLEDSFARLSHYSANLAHELRTPINTLMLESDIALAKGRTPQEYRRVIASSLEEYRRLSWIIDRLLFLARADLEANHLDWRRLNLRSEIEELFDYFSETACQAGVALEVHGQGTLCADQTLLRRALSNLIANALSATPPGGAIIVTIWQGDDLSVRVTVRDTGCGIEEAHLPRIFDRFYRAGEGGSPKAEGTGLGLAIVKSIMQMHGGAAGIRSEAGVGTTVTLEFPAPPGPIIVES
jgi:two-component system, OmpR family, heavy metal sensor histidine kinase CusS